MSKTSRPKMKFKRNTVVYQKPRILDKFTFFVFLLIILTIEILFIIFSTDISYSKRTNRPASPVEITPTPTASDTLKSITSDLQKIPLP